jgi:hypothetical protein
MTAVLHRTALRCQQSAIRNPQSDQRAFFGGRFRSWRSEDSSTAFVSYKHLAPLERKRKLVTEPSITVGLLPRGAMTGRGGVDRGSGLGPTARTVALLTGLASDRYIPRVKSRAFPVPLDGCAPQKAQIRAHLLTYIDLGSNSGDSLFVPQVIERLKFVYPASNNQDAGPSKLLGP